MLAVLLSLLLGAQALHGSEWSYFEGELDEAHWPAHYPDCGGQKQSPINLQRGEVRYNASLKPLELTGYGQQEGKFPMFNSGHTVQINLPATMRMTVPGGAVYIAEQVHFHWGGASSEIKGSEHTIEGDRYVIEIHVLHYNSKYENYDAAKYSLDGLAVLAALFEVDEEAENIFYTNFISHLAMIKYPGQRTTLDDLDVRDMLPENLDHYYSYQGSLTTPPCTENVQWFILAETVRLSRMQIWKLENSLLDRHNHTLQNDYRRTQPLNHRVVEANFRLPPQMDGYGLRKQGCDFPSKRQLQQNKINDKLNKLKKIIRPKKAKKRHQA